MMRAYFLYFFLFIYFFSHGQDCRRHIWNFSKGGRIEFIKDLTILNSVSPIPKSESVSTVTDCSGILFYSNGENIWNKNDSIMDGGADIGGHWSTSQAVSIIQNPMASNEYYVFSLSDFHDEGNLYYTMVNISANDGLGKVISKRNLIRSNLSEKMVSIKGQCNSAWLIVHERDNSNYLAYKIGENGISEPITSSTGSIVKVDPPINQGETRSVGKLKASSKGDLLVNASFEEMIEIVSFNIETGEISHPITIQSSSQTTSFWGSYSASFSKSGRYLFMYEIIGNINPLKIVRYDLESSDIPSTRTICYEGEHLYDHRQIDLRLSPHGEMIISGIDSTHLSALIDSEADEIIFDKNFHDLSGYFDHLSGLQVDPIYFDSTESDQTDFSILPKDTVLCNQETYEIRVPDTISVRWQDGSTASYFTVRNSGNYWVEYINQKGCLKKDSIQLVFDRPFIDLPADTFLCDHDPLIIELPKTNEYQWQDGSNSSKYAIPNSGDYWVNIFTKQGCIYTSDSFSVTYLETPIIDLGNDLNICKNDKLQLANSTDERSNHHLWSTGDTTEEIVVTSAGEYSLMITDQFGCTISDTITTTEDPDCPPDIADCHTYLPNAMSTISTRDNEAFYPQSSCPLYDYQMSIYDRWGGRVYFSSDPTQRWDGSSTDQTVMPGVYSYITHYRYSPDSDIVRHSGTITVIR